MLGSQGALGGEPVADFIRSVSGGDACAGVEVGSVADLLKACGLEGLRRRGLLGDFFRRDFFHCVRFGGGFFGGGCFFGDSFFGWDLLRNFFCCFFRGHGGRQWSNWNAKARAKCGGGDCQS